MAEGFFSRLRRAFDRALGRENAPPPEPEEIPQEQAPPEEEIPQEYQPEEEVIVYEPPDEEIQREPETQEGGCITGYYPGRIEGKHVRVKPRWYADNPDIDCIHSIMDASGRSVWITFIVCGTPEQEYPGKEGEDEICLGYVIRRDFAIQVAYSAQNETAVDFANALNAIYKVNLIGSWVQVTQVSIIDRR